MANAKAKQESGNEEDSHNIAKYGRRENSTFVTEKEENVREYQLETSTPPPEMETEDGNILGTGIWSSDK